MFGRPDSLRRRARRPCLDPALSLLRLKNPRRPASRRTPRLGAGLGAIVWCALAALALAGGPARAQAPEPTAAVEPAPVAIRIAYPDAGATVQGRTTMAPIRGEVQSGSGESADFDVLLAIDVSHSTRFPSGIDVDGDGDTGFNPKMELVAPGTYPDDMVCTDPEDTILAAEIEASRQLLEVLDPARTRVGVIVFSGAVDPATGKRVASDQRDALVKAPLTSDFDHVRDVLEQVLDEGSYGATNFAAALQLGVIELAGLSRSYSEPRPGARKVMLFLTDGVPTFPFGKGASADPEDTEAAISAARLARRAGITVNAFALGRHALTKPLALTEIARITRGSFTPVLNPGDITTFLQGITFANVDDVIVTNLTTGDVSFDVQLAPDGSFTGIVPVRIGDNVIEVAALASDGGEARTEVAFTFEESGLTERELAIELERIRKRNKALMRLIEQQRIEAFRERQRKRVEIEVEERAEERKEE